MAGIDAKASMQLARIQGANDGATSMADRLRSAAQSGDRKGVGEAAKKFEQYFVQTMMKEMRKASGSEDGLFSGSEMETFNSLFDEEISARISEGPGIGLAAMIERTLVDTYGAGSARGMDGVSGAVRAHHVPALAFPEGRVGWSWPLPDTEPGNISSMFGRRRDPITGGHKTHGGMDIAAPRGTPVLAMSGGEVVRAERSASYGNVVDIRHADGTISRYAHQARLDVEIGDEVIGGEQIGTVGSTGRSTGPHLHVEIHHQGNSLDPHAFLSYDEEK